MYKGHSPLCGEGSVILSRLKLSKMLQTSLVFVLLSCLCSLSVSDIGPWRSENLILETNFCLFLLGLSLSYAIHLAMVTA